MLGYVIVGTVAGFVTNVVALTLGASIWFALMLHSLAGFATMFLMMTVHVAMDYLVHRVEPVTNVEPVTVDDLGNVPSSIRAPDLMIDLPELVAAEPDRTVDILAPRVDDKPLEGLRDSRNASHAPKATQDVVHVGIEEPRRSMRILAVDDDPFILGLIPGIAAKAGFCEVVSVASGQLALEELTRTGIIFDCLLLDISMPAMNGIELCKRVREIPDYQLTPIIMLTGMRDRKSIDDAFQAGATDYATKPFDVVELGQRLNQVREMIESPVNWFSELDANLVETADGTSREDFALSDDFQLDGVANFISRGAMTNYLTQLSVADATNTSIVAVKVDWFDKVCSRTSYLPFNSILRGVAAALNDIIGTDKYMVAYAGDATILITAHAAELPASIELEAEINRALRSTPAERPSHDRLSVNVSVGRSMQPGGCKSKRAAISFGRAIGSANNRSLEKQSGGRPRHIRLVG